MAKVVDLVSDTFGSSAEAGSAEAGKGAVKLDTDGTLAGNSDSAVPTQKAVKTFVGASVGMATTTDGTLAANSDALVPTEKAVKTYVDTGLATKQGTITSHAITGALSTVADAPAKAVLTSIINALVAEGLATDTTT